MLGHGLKQKEGVHLAMPIFPEDGIPYEKERPETTLILRFITWRCVVPGESTGDMRL